MANVIRFNHAQLKALREQAGFTQHELALAAGLKEYTIWAYESKRRAPSFTTLARLSDVLDVHPFTLLEVSIHAE